MPKLDYSRRFLEAQLPVSKLSKECYKERKSNYSQTLTGLGKWWGRKPLVLVRATILGLLLPVSDDPRRDREVYLKLLTMDDHGLRRRNKGMPTRAIFARLTPAEREEHFTDESSDKKARFKKPVAEHRSKAEATAFWRMTYDEKLAYCLRPEEIDGPDTAAWEAINTYLGGPASGTGRAAREKTVRAHPARGRRLLRRRRVLGSWSPGGIPPN